MPPEDDVTRLTVAAIIPTKNRPGLLASIVERLLAQTATIDELVIVDQSDTDEGRVAVRRALEAVPASRRPALDHVWDREINGAAAARNVAFDRTRSDVLLCVDDEKVPIEITPPGESRDRVSEDVDVTIQLGILDDR